MGSGRRSRLLSPFPTTFSGCMGRKMIWWTACRLPGTWFTCLARHTTRTVFRSQPFADRIAAIHNASAQANLPMYRPVSPATLEHGVPSLRVWPSIRVNVLMNIAVPYQVCGWFHRGAVCSVHYHYLDGQFRIVVNSTAFRTVHYVALPLYRLEWRWGALGGWRALPPAHPPSRFLGRISSWRSLTVFSDLPYGDFFTRFCLYAHCASYATILSERRKHATYGTGMGRAGPALSPSLPIFLRRIRA